MKSYHVTRQWFNKMRARCAFWKRMSVEIRAAAEKTEEKLRETQSLLDASLSREDELNGQIRKEKDKSLSLTNQLNNVLKVLSLDADLVRASKWIRDAEFKTHLIEVGRAANFPVRAHVENNFGLKTTEICIELERGYSVTSVSDQAVRHGREEVMDVVLAELARHLSAQAAMKVQEAVLKLRSSLLEKRN